MYSAPSIEDEAFKELLYACYKKHLRLLLARNYRAYQDMGGNYAVYCKFSELQLCTAESIEEIYSFLRIEPNDE